MLQLGKKIVFCKILYFTTFDRLDFQPLEEEYGTLGLLNILNGINIANPWPMYAATRAYLKNIYYKISHFTTFANILTLSSYKKTGQP